MSNIITSHADRVLTIVISREAQRNALNAATRAEIIATLRATDADADIGAVIITGAGDKAFVAGADIGELRALADADDARQMSEESHELGFLIADMTKPVIAVINGYALGGGLELAMACDIRLAADSASMGQPEIDLGIIPGWGGTQRLPRLVGGGMALLLCLSGERISAAEALRIGLVERVYPAAELPGEAQKFAAALARKAPTAVAAIKRAVAQGAAMSLRDACLFEAGLFGAVVASADAKAGLSAFLERGRRA